MPKSSLSGSFGQRGGTVTVIDQNVQRSFARKAKFAFYVVWAAAGLLTATILVGPWQHRFGSIGGGILAFLAGAVTGLILAAIVASIVAAWPVIRAIWWWLPELALTGGLITGFTELASHTDLVVRLIAMAAILGVPAAIRPVRGFLLALAWCQISRHRIRTCFSEFIITNRTGTLPLILGARPTPAGTRLWVFLRPGLSLADIQQRADKLAAGCWASTVVADQASASNAAFVRIDIKRRDPLTGIISSPLKAVLGGIRPLRRASEPPAPVDLDLTDVLEADVINPPKNGTGGGSPARPKWPTVPARTDAEPVGSLPDEVSDWI
jgi:hypothetical protein